MNVSSAVLVPSETVTVISASPVCPLADVSEMLPLPETRLFVIFAFGISVWFDEVTVAVRLPKSGIRIGYSIIDRPQCLAPIP